MSIHVEEERVDVPHDSSVPLNMPVDSYKEDTLLHKNTEDCVPPIEKDHESIPEPFVGYPDGCYP